MRLFILTILISASTLSLQAQDIFICKELNIHFFSEAPLENIEASTSKSVSAINLTEKTVFFKVPIKAFEFEKALMQEHFNENYMESEEFPYGIYKGTFTVLGSAERASTQDVSDMDPKDIDITVPGVYEIEVTGTMEIHGVKKAYVEKGTLTVTKDGLELDHVFTISVADHDIEIPSIVVQNIAEEIEVTVKGSYKRK